VTLPKFTLSLLTLKTGAVGLTCRLNVAADADPAFVEAVSIAV
jgi:hypothetical protein